MDDPSFPPKGGFLGARDVPCVCVGWVFCEVTGWFGIIGIMFCLSHCQVSFFFPNVGFAACVLSTIDDI